jgi:hypothetical protein
MKQIQKHLQEVMTKNPSCYVLISCGQPSENGDMQVEMTYYGDAGLASYLVQGAQHFFEENETEPDYSVVAPAAVPLRLIK